ncbi:protein hu-li tai shao-like isoform X7 [Penaeus japonicus]|uniref:protein hu-li tai shao-like isoform X7 n=1 Tax=Penaeus japonicus TaxID=27405 RepID=UPI001C715FC1|nr:protein hu-li tai shao-like isoform X7 [Penaeus japonicus]
MLERTALQAPRMVRLAIVVLVVNVLACLLEAGASYPRDAFWPGRANILERRKEVKTGSKSEGKDCDVVTVSPKMSDGAVKQEPAAAHGMNGTATQEEEVRLMTEEELEREKMRPPDIDQDMKEMERRKRVEAIMNSTIFREELEKIVETQISEGYSGVQAIQNISEMMGFPSTRVGVFRGGSCVIPINDIRGMESLSFAKGEKLLRCKLAAVYRLIDMHGWTQSIYNHCTARLSQDTEHFLLNPFGMLYHEVTAASLVKVDMQGNVVDGGATNFGVNVAGFMLHSAIHAARPDLKCVIHLHHPAVVAVSALKQGLMPLSQESLLIGEVSYHDYQGIFVNAEEKEKLGRNLGPVNKILMLRNHGVVCCGETVEEAWYNTYHTVLACETQMRMAPLGLDNLVVVSDEARQAAYEVARRGGGGVDSKQEGGPAAQGQKERKWKVGELEFEALMRSLDNAGLRTGYIYRRPLVKQETTRVQSDVALPPTASNYTHLFDEDDISRSPLKRILDGRKTQDKTRWLNSPNVYQKVEVLETGTPDPKKITKWVADGSPTHSTSTPVKVESALQFVPTNTNPKEFKTIQKMIKENRRVGSITSGPTSHLLEGVTWDEARRMQDASMSGASDHVILVGAASKGIIQRDFQHNAVVYKTPYAKNPFDCVTDKELDEYRELVERKQRGDPIEEIEIEKMNIMPERATVDVVDDSVQDSILNTTAPTSPTSDQEDGSPIADPQLPPVAGGDVWGQGEVTPPPSGPATLSRSPTVQAGEGQLTPRTNSLTRGIQKMLKAASRSKEDGMRAREPSPTLERSKSAFYKSEVANEKRSALQRRSWSLSRKGETVANGDDTEAHHSTLSQSSKEGSPTKDTSLTDDSISKDKKKKKKGLRTPSFLKKKKDKKKEKEAAHH